MFYIVLELQVHSTIFTNALYICPSSYAADTGGIGAKIFLTNSL